MPVQGSTVVRRQLGRRLHQLREAARITERDVEKARFASRTKLWRIETGRTPVKVADVLALCGLYGADKATTTALTTLATGTNQHGWWEDFGDAVPTWFNLYVGLESSASTIQIYDPELVHGLLQTPDYVRALYAASPKHFAEEVIQRQIKLRGERQQALVARKPPLHVVAVLNAAVLARPVGGKQVMHDQIERLCELQRLDHVDIRVLGWDVGGHAALHMGAFTILGFDCADDPDVVYREAHTGAQYLERDHELREYRDIFAVIHQQAVPIEEYVP